MSLSFSNVGFGCYRIDHSIEEHYEALYKALSEGVDLIDTSANYYDGGSEILVGKVVNDLIRDGKIKRKDITVVTKGGYIQGQNLRFASGLKKEGKLFPEVVEESENLWHSINPEFIEDQMHRQLHRLDLKYIDVYLLHNPEYYLQWAQKNRIEKSDAKEIYYDRIRRAFEFLEQKVSEGVINYYGISSNTFVTRSDRYDFTSFEEILNIANSISGNNHFRVIQLPFNLLETGAFTIRNQVNDTETVLGLAAKENIKVLVNRPLNAVSSKGLVRFADFRAEPFQEKDFIKQIKLVTLMEDDMTGEKLADENLNEEDYNKIKRYLTFGKLIEDNWKFFGSIEHFNDMLSQLFAPRIDFMVNFFEKKIHNENVTDFFERYIKECYRLLNFVSNYYRMRAEKRSSFINELINTKLNREFHDLSLSQKSVLILNSIEGVSCVLVGMRKERYVDDILKVMDHAKIPNAAEIIGYVSREVEAANT